MVILFLILLIIVKLLADAFQYNRTSTGFFINMVLALAGVLLLIYYISVRY